MPEEFKYSLTRICLRSGQLTLPRSLLELFPEEGGARALDTVRQQEFELVVYKPRTVAGFANFFDFHNLDVNDAVIISALETGSYSITPLKHERKPDYQRQEVVDNLLEEVLELAPLAEAEIRELYSDLPATAPLARWLSQDERFSYFQGRWHDAEVLRADAKVRRRQQQAEHDFDESLLLPTDFLDAELLTAPVAAVPALNAVPANAEAATKSNTPAKEALAAENSASQPPDSQALDTALTPLPSAASLRNSSSAAHRSDNTSNNIGNATSNNGSGNNGFSNNGANNAETAKVSSSKRSVVTSYSTRPSPSSLNYLDGKKDSEYLLLHNRARELLLALGYRVDVISQGMLAAIADLGRRQYKVLVYVQPPGVRIDWNHLQSRRRELGYNYLAVFGEQREFSRFLKRQSDHATLWPWPHIERLEELSHSLPLGPADLESHFARDGLAEEGLTRFENAMEQHIRERGDFSLVISRLARLRAPAVFLLDDVLSDADVPRDQIVHVLTLLSHAPFHVVTKVADGEFCLRCDIAQGLLHLSQYALSLHAHLPQRHGAYTERLRGGLEADAEEFSDDFVTAPSVAE